MKKLIPLILTSLLAISASADDVDRSALDDAYQKWSAAGIANYQFTLTWRENWGASRTALVIVTDGALESAGTIIRRSHPIPENEASDASGLRKTIDDLFAGMQSSDYFLRAKFDDTTGRPIDISYQHEEWDDVENQYEIRDFETTQ
jgi:hypothetical protein